MKQPASLDNKQKNLTRRVVIVIPTYDEKGNIGRCIAALEQVFKAVPPAYEMHILVVDDSSPDGTADEVRQKIKEFKNVHLLVNKQKMGLGGAYLSGMKYAAAKFNPDIFFEFDADLSHDPKLVPQFLAKLEQGYDLVLGSRYIKGGSIPHNWGLKRKFYSVVGNMIIMTVLTDFRVRDWTTGYRALRRKVYESVYPLLGEERFFGYPFQIGFLHKAVRLGFKIGEVPLNFVDRTLGRSKLGAEYIKNTLIYIFKARISELSRFIKFGTVGFIGYIINATTLSLFTSLWNIEWISWLLSTELAIISNFTLNNIWTFKSDKITGISKVVAKFLQFNITSAGALFIQTVVGTIGVIIFGSQYRQLLLPLIILFLVLPYNWLMYNKIIWKKR